ncbi:unnamed protein product [Peniophora sp. CBMAI 1063]|nr:unnamed protein product [Peniophora sp. CBMAI 1063]
MSHKKSGSLLNSVLVAEGARRERERQRADSSQSSTTVPHLSSPSASQHSAATQNEALASSSDSGSLTVPPDEILPPQRPTFPVYRPFPLKLPPGHNTSVRAFYYGYMVTDETMYQYLLPRVGKYIDEDEVGTMHLTHATALCLQRESGIRTPLHFKTALVDDTNRDLPRWENPPRIPIISVTSSYSLEFDKRPTQEQLEKLTALLGSMPRWWLDSWHNEDTT